jgi:hypothetical protein
MVFTGGKEILEIPEVFRGVILSTPIRRKSRFVKCLRVLSLQAAMQPVDADKNKNPRREGQETQDDLRQSQCNQCGRVRYLTHGRSPAAGIV